MVRILSDKAIQGLKQYKYKAGGYTILDYIHEPIWEWLVSCLPMWIAPNLITLVAFMGMVISFGVQTYYSPDYDSDVPSWVSWLCAIAMIVYVNLDCMDGKQARRTGSSSPLGQLFDHGCDALAVFIALSNVAGSLKMGWTWKTITGFHACMIPFFLGQWQEYHTGKMFYGNGLYGVLEANYSIAIVHVITAVIGQKFWNNILATALVSGHIIIIRNSDFLLIMVVSASILQSLEQLIRVMTIHCTDMSQEERGDKELGRVAAISHITKFFLIVLVAIAYQQTSYEGIYGPRFLASVWGLSFALIATQIILAHMCKQSFNPAWEVIFIILIALYLKRIPTLKYVDEILLSIVGFVYDVYIIAIVYEVSVALDINCFTIKRKEL